jgi:hypothetical protein
MFSHLAKSADTNKLLLEHFEYRDINQAKKKERFKKMTAQQIYDILLKDFNDELDKTNEKIKKLNEKKAVQKQKQQQNQVKNMKKNINKLLEVAHKKVLKEIEKEITRKTKNINDFLYKNELKAFGGSFHQVNLKLADDTDYNDLKALTNNTILNNFT